MNPLIIIILFGTCLCLMGCSILFVLILYRKTPTQVLQNYNANGTWKITNVGSTIGSELSEGDKGGIGTTITIKDQGDKSIIVDILSKSLTFNVLDRTPTYFHSETKDAVFFTTLTSIDTNTMECKFGVIKYTLVRQ